MNTMRRSIFFYSQATSSVPPRLHECIYHSKVKSVGSFGFQTHLCILACEMSREFTCEAVIRVGQGRGGGGGEWNSKIPINLPIYQKLY